MRATSDIRSVRQLTVSLRDARVLKGMTQAELAEKAGVSRPWINQFEQGKLKNASVDRVLALCRILGVTPSVSYDVPDGMVDAVRDPSQIETAKRLGGDDASVGIESPVVDGCTSEQAIQGARHDSSSSPSMGTKILLSNVDWQEMTRQASKLVSPAIDFRSVSQLIQQWSGAESLFGESYIQALKNLDLSHIGKADVPAGHQLNDSVIREESEGSYHEQDENA